PRRVRVERPGAAERDIAPDVAEKLLLLEDARGIGRELDEQLELLAGERDTPIVDRRPPRRRVDDEAGRREALVRVRGAAAENGVDARDELLVHERPRDVVIAAAREGAHAVDGPVVLGAEDDDGTVGAPPLQGGG